MTSRCRIINLSQQCTQQLTQNRFYRPECKTYTRLLAAVPASLPSGLSSSSRSPELTPGPSLSRPHTSCVFRYLPETEAALVPGLCCPGCPGSVGAGGRGAGERVRHERLTARVLPSQGPQEEAERRGRGQRVQRSVQLRGRGGGQLGGEIGRASCRERVSSPV